MTGETEVRKANISAQSRIEDCQEVPFRVHLLSDKPCAESMS